MMLNRTGDKNRAKLNIICFFDIHGYLLLIHHTVAEDVIRDIAFSHYFVRVSVTFSLKSIKIN